MVAPFRMKNRWKFTTDDYLFLASKYLLTHLLLCNFIRSEQSLNGYKLYMNIPKRRWFFDDNEG